MATTKSDVMKLLNYMGYAYPLVVFLTCGIASAFVPYTMPYAVFFWLLWYDMGGYNFVLQRREMNEKGWKRAAPKTAEAAYRFTSFWEGVNYNVAGTLICWGFYSWQNAIFVTPIFMILFLTGNKEVQYYLFFHDPLAPEWKWSQWTTAGWFKKSPPTANDMMRHSMIGGLLSVAVTIVWIFINLNIIKVF